MFGLLRLAFSLLICVLVVGFFLGWFTFAQTQADPQTNKVNINVGVDKRKIGNDLQHFEQRVNLGIQGLQNGPANPDAVAGQRTPGLSLGPISFQPSGQTNGQPAGQGGMPAVTFGPISIQPSAFAPQSPNPPQNGQYNVPAPGYQYTAPINLPPPGER